MKKRILSSKNEEEASVPAVYMTTAITSEGLMDIYQALQVSPVGNIAGHW